MKSDIRRRLELSKVQFSYNDIKRGVKVPVTLTEDLAYETGVHAGDGYLGIFKHKTGQEYTVVYSGDSNEEYEYHLTIIVPLVQKLYNIRCTMRKDHKNTVRTYLRSKAIATFKQYVLGLPNRKKTGSLRVPEIIRASNDEIKCAFLAGLVDTDFSLVFVRGGKYPKITAGFPSENREFVGDIVRLFSDVGIGAHACLCNRQDFRYDPVKTYKAFKIDISGRKNLQRWLEVAGFRSSKHLTKLKVWKECGYCPRYTTIEQRKNMLASVAQR